MTTPAERTEAVKPDWYDRPTEPGLWLAKRGHYTAELVEIDDDAMQITPAEWGIKRWLGPLPPDTKEEK